MGCSEECWGVVSSLELVKNYLDFISYFLVPQRIPRDNKVEKEREKKNSGLLTARKAQPLLR